MHDAAAPALAAWSNFYVIAGSSAAALTGLMFVVITLTAGQRSQISGEGIATFNSPTVVHFCCALLISVILTAPWHSVAHAGVLIAAVGLYGVVYAVRVTHRIRTRMRELYSPGTDDWVWYAILPIVAYAGVLGAALALFTAPTPALFALAAAAMLLIFMGIHNAWDVVTYLAVKMIASPDDDAAGADGERQASPAEPPPPPPAPPADGR